MIPTRLWSDFATSRAGEPEAANIADRLPSLAIDRHNLGFLALCCAMPSMYLHDYFMPIMIIVVVLVAVTIEIVSAGDVVMVRYGRCRGYGR